MDAVVDKTKIMSIRHFVLHYRLCIAALLITCFITPTNARHYLSAHDMCNLPRLSGVCTKSITRYYFNGRYCNSFIYSGCLGNANNFFTLEQCIKDCVEFRMNEKKRKPHIERLFGG